MNFVARLLEAGGSCAVGMLAVSSLHAAHGWWLELGPGGVASPPRLAALGFFATVWRIGHPWIRASGLWAGAMIEMTLLLFRVGPGTIWPIVLVFAAGISGAAVFGGAWLASLASRASLGSGSAQAQEGDVKRDGRDARVTAVEFAEVVELNRAASSCEQQSSRDRCRAGRWSSVLGTDRARHLVAAAIIRSHGKRTSSHSEPTVENVFMKEVRCKRSLNCRRGQT